METFFLSGWVCLPLLIGLITALLAYIVWQDSHIAETNHDSAQDPRDVSEINSDQLSALKKMLSRGSRRSPRGASQILDFLYLSGELEATNRKLLAELGITHVINCAAGDCATGRRYYSNSIQYMEITAQDEQLYDIMQHFGAVFSFIEKARKVNGKVLIHCVMGVNRSAALAVAYIMVHKNLDALGAVELVVKSRTGILRNQGFQRQIVQFQIERKRWQNRAS